MIDPSFIADQYGIHTEVDSDFHKLYTDALRSYHRRTSGPLSNEVVSLIFALTDVNKPVEKEVVDELS